MSNIYGVGIEHFEKWNERNKKLKIKEILPLSYSQLTDFAFNRPRWALRRVFGYQFPTSAAAERGSAVETGIKLLFNRHKKSDAVEAMYRDFDANLKNVKDDYISWERNNLERLLNESWNYLKNKNLKVLDYQRKVETQIFDIPIIGYTDFHFEDKETKEDYYLDLKTSKRKPSDINLSHAMQQSIYLKATNARQELLYAIIYANEIKMLPLTIKDTKTPLRIAEQIIKAMSNFLCNNKTEDDVRNSLVPDIEHWTWNYPKGNDGSLIKARKEVWGF